MKLKKLFSWLIFLSLLPCIEWFCHKQTDGFSLDKIRSHFELTSIDDESNLWKKEVDQPFYYLAKGAQCYVFVSKDQKFILKFFKQYRYRLPLYCKLFSKEKIVRLVQKKEMTREGDFSSYRLAYEKLKEETGLLYLHLTPTAGLKKCTIFDKIGVRHEIDLNDFQFILQKKAILAKDKIKELTEKNEIEKAKQCLTDLAGLLLKRMKKGIADSDPNLIKNFGFVESTPMQIDIGRFSQHSDVSSGIKKKVGEFQYWLNELSPILGNHFQKEMHPVVNFHEF
ncbi:MAG: hypothetical protein L0207_03560 [Chlamydiae bacterium]|nr:hypothetical protein [Chlamydiota bacterium]